MEHGFVCPDVFRSRAISHGFGEDSIAVFIISDEEVLVSATGWDDETPSLVSMKLTGDAMAGSIEGMLFGSVGVRRYVGGGVIITFC